MEPLEHTAMEEELNKPEYGMLGISFGLDSVKD
jgi:hypothetical protein